MSVIVLGAGVVGLTTALRLQELQPGLKLTVLADKFDADTTSAGAAGIFRPANSFSGPDHETTREWIYESYKYYCGLLNEKCGISEISGFIFSNNNPSIVKNQYLEGLVKQYRQCSREELCFHGNQYKYGCFFTTLLIQCTEFLPWARARLEKAGVTFMRMKIENLEDVRGLADVIVNCTGLGSSDLAFDSSVVPIRGQVLKMNAPWLDKFYYLDVDTYIIPTSPYITVGGSRHYDSWSTESCHHDAAAILERAGTFLPSLKTAEVIKTWTGLRPHRQKVRVESEHINGLKVIHNYGHGGYGVTTAPGTGLAAAKLALQLLSTKAKL